eukprot:TRINITY_DN5575_c0_g1_i1.p1 TRINITY_DN5575_c0_g1~~TRINITY_DN5575_c0_g1_i1.p1  ORF type:complete len:199 (-),score=26.62 TRINITY_DN5575_c0_g1_i1:38-634(-)
MWQKEASDEEVREFFTSRGCTAASDFPAALFYKRLVKVFPDAKVVLTTRNPSNWQKSMKESLYLSYCNRTKWPWRWSLFAIDWRFHRGLDELYDVMDGVWLDAVLGDEKQAVTFFDNWEEEVRKSVPKENLILFKASDGWGPLCTFLEKNVPTNPYPRLNNSQQFQEGHNRFRLLTCLLGGFFLLAFLGFINYFVPMY